VPQYTWQVVKDGDIVVYAAAKAPAKNWEMLAEKCFHDQQHRRGTKNKIISSNCLHLPYPDNFFDASVAINTIYNLDVVRLQTSRS
jgi:hypothetical protein